MMWSISDLKRKEPNQYGVIKKMIVTDQNYKIIDEIKATTYLSNTEPIFQYYDNLREEGRISSVQTSPSNQQTNNNQGIAIGHSMNSNSNNAGSSRSSNSSLDSSNMILQLSQANLI